MVKKNLFDKNDSNFMIEKTSDAVIFIEINFFWKETVSIFSISILIILQQFIPFKNQSYGT